MSKHSGASAMSPTPQAPSGRRIMSVRDRAGFEAIPPDIDIDALVEQKPNFKPVPSLDAQDITPEAMPGIERYVYEMVIVKGMPLVIKNWHKRSDWPRWIFDTEWLKQNHGSDHIHVRDLTNQQDVLMTLGHYINNLGKLARRFTPHDYSRGHQRLYGKDLDCPEAWRKALSRLLPSSTFYLSEDADLMSSLPPAARAENMMCYVGHEGTYTPAHREMCGSLGQNIMVHTSSGDKEPGSSIWFMTSSTDRDNIAEYWLSHMGHDIEVESHFASIEDLSQAPFTVFVHEQKLGDYILVPPLAPHQVWNRGEVTVKAAWNRTTVDTLELAIAEALPKARLVCRDEQYKNRAIIYETLMKYARALTDAGAPRPQGIDETRLKRDFVRLFKLFDGILLDECFSPVMPTPTGGVEKIPNEHNVQCSFCRGNIWNRFLSCKNCIPEPQPGDDEDCYDVCMDCYARGRSCGCVSDLVWVEQHNWDTLKQHHDFFRQIVLRIQGTITDESPVPLDQALKNLGRKTLARVCQEQLKVRPWVDINKNGLESEEDETKTNDRGLNCHVCKIRHPRWKCAECHSCNKAYCYGNLWRAFDMDPFSDVLSKFKWKCPVCLGICSCGACRKKGDTVPFTPNGTFLGASTKHVADPRSVETLVDFARGNLGWVKEGVKERKRKRDSIASLDSPDAVTPGPFTKAFNDANEFAGGSPDGIPIDPALGGAHDSADGNGSSNSRAEGRFSPDLSSYPREEHASNALGAMQALPMAVPQPMANGADGAASGDGAEGPGNQVSDRAGPPMLPSPSAMLTGALPAGTHDPSYIDTTTASGSGFSNNYINQLHSSSSSYTLPNETVSNILQNKAFLEQHDIPFGDLSALEQNPMAFIAAAGLMQLPNSSPATTGSPPFPPFSAPFTAEPPSRPVAAEAPTVIRPQLLQLQPESSRTPASLPRRPRRTQDIDFASPALTPDREAVVGSWVRKTKATHQKLANLRRKKKSLVVVLRPPRDRYRSWFDEHSTADLVISDLRVLPSGMYVPIEAHAQRRPPRPTTPPVPRRPGRPRKANESDDDTVDALDVDIDDDEEMVLQEMTPRSKMKEETRRRRQQKWEKRKKEEAEAKAAFIKSQQEKQARSASTLSDTANAPKGRKRRKPWHDIGAREIIGVFGSDTDSGNEPSAEESPALPPPPEETEEEKAARLAMEEEVRRKREEAAAVARAEAAERIKRAAAEAEERRKQAAIEAAIEAAERRRVKAEARAVRRAEKVAQRRIEEDKRAKLVAAGILASSDAELSSASSSESSESESEREDVPTTSGVADDFTATPHPPTSTFPEPVEGFARFADFYDTDDDMDTRDDAYDAFKETFLFPTSKSLAVVIPVPFEPGWRDVYRTYPLTPSPEPQYAPIAPMAPFASIATPQPTTSTAKRKRGRPSTISTASTPAPTAGDPQQKHGRGRPRKSSVASSLSQPLPPTTAGKKRGRPRKSSVSTLSQTPAAPGEAQSQSTGKKRGRPRKSAGGDDAGFKLGGWKNSMPDTTRAKSVRERKAGSASLVELSGSDEDSDSNGDELSAMGSTKAGKARGNSGKGKGKGNAKGKGKEPQGKKRKVLRRKKIVIAPGRWAEIEISESEEDPSPPSTRGSAEKAPATNKEQEKRKAAPLSQRGGELDLRPGELERLYGDGDGEDAGMEDVEVEVEEEYEKRWAGSRRRRW